MHLGADGDPADPVVAHPVQPRSSSSAAAAMRPCNVLHQAAAWLYSRGLRPAGALEGAPCLGPCAGGSPCRRRRLVPRRRVRGRRRRRRPTASTTTTATTAPAPVEGLVATVATNRLYVVDHAFRRRAAERRRRARRAIERIRLASGLFEPADPGDQSVQLQAGGRRFVLPAPYGPPRCGDAAEPTFAVDVVLADGRELHVPAVEEFPGAIMRLHERECFTVDVHERVDVRLGDDWTQDGIAIHGELLLSQRHLRRRRGRRRRAATSSSRPRPTPSGSTTTTPRPRCRSRSAPTGATPTPSPSSSGRTSLLAYVAVGDGEPTAVELEATGAAQAAFQALIASCSTGP